ncbi:MAG: transglutaminase family protein [Chloroflexota bacterium]
MDINQDYLQPTPFIDSDSPAIIEFANAHINESDTAMEKGIKLYYAVRDGIRYSPYMITLDPETYKASWLLEGKVGYCIQKAILLAAVVRVAGIPSRLGFGDVRNHLASPRLLEVMQTDEFYYHGYTELYLDGKWVKSTPAFNRTLCDKFGVLPLEFDGQTDSIFHPFDADGNRHMEYIRDHGQFAEFPFDRMVDAFQTGYPHLLGEGGSGWPKGNLEKEATRG